MCIRSVLLVISAAVLCDSYRLDSVQFFRQTIDERSTYNGTGDASAGWNRTYQKEPTELAKEYCQGIYCAYVRHKERCDYHVVCCHSHDEPGGGFGMGVFYIVNLEPNDFCNEKIRYTDECPNGRTMLDEKSQRFLAPSHFPPEEHSHCPGLQKPPKCSGPQDTDDLHRLGSTSFYVFQNAERANMVDWHGAKFMCESVGLTLAKIEDLQTDVLVSRQLEKFIRPLGWIDNWYWMNAKFDRSLKTYVWQDTMTPLNFSNFYYRPPRPKGYGDFFDIQGDLVSEPTIEHCLAFSMPLPFPKTLGTEGLVPYGFHTAWWERPCDSKKKGNILCKSHDVNCQEARQDSIYTEESGDYYKQFWPMSNRRFVVMWASKSYDEAKSLCEEYKMKLYSPNEDDSCLSQNLKNWMKTVTSYSFWTDVKYKVKDKTFIYPDGKDVPSGVQNLTTHVKELKKREAGEEIEETCASITWNYEEFQKNINFCNCTINSLVLSPENCNNNIGVICQHLDDQPRNCTTEFYEKAPPLNELITFDSDHPHPKIKEFYPFNSDREWFKGIIRSAYKQQGSSGQCPKTYQRVTINDTYWGTEEDFEKSNYTYDFLTPYWLRKKNETCRLSTVTYNPDEKKLSRTITNEDCSKWLGFVLCKKKPIQGRGMPRSLGDYQDNYKEKKPAHSSPFYVAEPS